MPTSGKLFAVDEPKKLADISAALEGYREQSEYEEGVEPITLVADVVNLTLTEENLWGQFAFDSVRSSEFRGVVKTTPFTTYADFLFFKEEETTYCLILASKNIANAVANKLSTIAFGEEGVIRVPQLDTSRINDFYRKSPAAKVLLMDNLDTPNLNKLTMYGGKGGNLIETDLFGRYRHNGDPWYVVFKEQISGETIGLVRDGTVVVFGNMDANDYAQFIQDYILPLVLPYRRKEA